MEETIKKRSPRTLILVMTVVVLVGILTARVYYSGINKKVDPRIIPAREAYQIFNQKAQQSDFEGVLEILDSISAIYESIPCYSKSYETGVIHINRAAVFITVGLHLDSLKVNHSLGFMSNLTRKGLLDLAENEILEGIGIYTNWNKDYLIASSEEMRQLLGKTFFSGLENYQEKERAAFFEARIKELETAQWENDRRLSVAYTNLGIIYFNRDDFQEAAEHFNKALELWEDNLNAENNLNSMLGRPLRKKNFIQKMFPKNKNEV